MGNKMFNIVALVAMAALLCSALPNDTKAQETQEQISIKRIKENYIRHSNSRKLSSTINLSKVKDRQIIIKTKEINKILSKISGIKLLQSHEILISKDIYIIRVPEWLNYSGVLKALKKNPIIDTVEPNYLQERTVKAKPLLEPNDKFYKDQWYLNKIGVQAIWPFIKPNSKPVTVAVLDTGVDTTHPDLKGQLVNGYDIPRHTTKQTDKNGHGTAVAGTIAAKMNNKIGIVGVNPYAKILPIKIGGEEIADADSIAGIYYAIKHHADIINLSYGGPESSETEFDAILSAAQHGITVVAASGNEYGEAVEYPAAYPTVISVGSVNSKNKVSDFSNVGPQLDLVAPGEKIKILALKNKYDIEDGTSFSTPIVSGLASIIKSIKPEMTPSKIEYILEKGATPLAKSPNIWSPTGGYGAVKAANPLTIKLPDLKDDVGNERSKAKTIALNKSYTNKYDLPLDSDWYKLKVTKNMTLKAELSGVTNMDGVVWVDKYSKGKVTKEEMHNKGKLGGKESFIFKVTPGTYYFEILEGNNHWSTKPYHFIVKKVDVTPPAPPKVNSFNSKDRKLTGKAEKGANLVLKNGSKIIAKGKVTSKSTFSLSLKAQKAGTKLYLTATDAAGNKSKATKIIVKKAK
ncbi:S8 family serine peptidase [Heyndrickxia sporothermodurans]|uniref:S8 family serine peptidase n=1 Tax=Heyndrickxia sporothermodurans TaxID=46224 RepID=UPI002E1F1AB5|nr:S8 family serine peptidase [Heyndrickxia sporothermodurans]MED3653681.1 S8 family serine peptidase [Heyndrickxia sporothermodurans]